jgi:mRNA interferase RelE/StbE
VFSRLPPTARCRTKAAIDPLANDPTLIGATPLRGRDSAYRIRLENYRVVYDVHATEIVVCMVGTAHRREIYRTMLKGR